MNEHLPAPPNSVGNTMSTDSSNEGASTAEIVKATYESGWYPDPHGGPGLRYFDGNEWTTHRHTPPLETVPVQNATEAPAPAAPAAPQIVVNTYVAQSAGGGGGAGQKSAVVAFVLTFFFGPLGMLYSTIAGGLIMLAVGFILVPLTFGLILPIVWPIQLVWAVVAANNANKAGGGNANAGPGAGGFANQVAS
jgi:hypothetical protein